jgi:hypothetical protein
LSSIELICRKSIDYLTTNPSATKMDPQMFKLMQQEQQRLQKEQAEMMKQYGISMDAEMAEDEDPEVRALMAEVARAGKNCVFCIFLVRKGCPRRRRYR